MLFKKKKCFIDQLIDLTGPLYLMSPIATCDSGTEGFYFKEES